MIYNPLIPQDQPPASYQAQIKNNFTVFDQALVKNHEPMNSDIQGYHTNLLMKQQSGNPNRFETIGTLFCKNITNTIGTSKQVFYSSFVENDDINNPNVRQLTYNQIGYTGNNQQSFCLGGFVVFMGTGTFVTTGNAVITLTPSVSKLIFISGSMSPGTGNSIFLNGTDTSTSSPLVSQVTFSTSTSPNTAYTLNYLIIGYQ